MMRKPDSKPSREELLSRQEVLDQIAEGAYFLALAEGFPPGQEVTHWLRAESEVVARLQKQAAPSKAVVAANNQGANAKNKTAKA